MELTDNYISVTDETILAFYRENKLDFIEMNHIFININTIWHLSFIIL